MIGTSIVHQLVKKGDEVHVIDDLSRGKKENLKDVWSRISFLEFDLTQPIPESQKQFWSVDRVLHLASFVGGVKVGTKEATRATVIPTIDRNVVLACVKNGVKRLLYTSTAYYDAAIFEGIRIQALYRKGFQRLRATGRRQSLYESCHS